MLSVTKQFRFAFAHHLPNHPGLCKNLHGHSGKLEVTIYSVGGPDKTTGMVMDFGVLKKIVNEAVVDVLDHSCLNDVVELPTAENMILWILDRLEWRIPPHIKIKRLRLWEEIDSAYAEWEGV